MQQFTLGINYLRGVQIFNEAGDLVHHGVNVTTFISHNGKAKLGTLPQLVITNLSNGNVKLVLGSIHNLSKYLALLLERITAVYTNVQSTDPNDHGCKLRGKYYVKMNVRRAMFCCDVVFPDF